MVTGLAGAGKLVGEPVVEPFIPALALVENEENVVDETGLEGDK